ncbi:MAG TPA: hypothetical protein VFA98_11605 [Thermoanaerobaculia bacterium]|nr:hypothetical protein [Thermoanaerobaculia bacterium]
MAYYWESYDKEKLDDHIMGWRDRAYVAEKLISRLLGIDLNQAVAEAGHRIGHPLGKEEEWKGEHHEWIAADIVILEGALARLRVQEHVLKAGGDCPCADCRGVDIDLDRVPPDIEGTKPSE